MLNSERILFRIFLATHFIVWTAVGLFRSSIAMDTAEAMIWGREWTFGTNKHPYLSGWVAESFRQGCLGDCHWAAALLASVCTTLGIWFAYRLARRFLDRSRAMISAMLLEGCVYYNVCGLEYNCNLLSIVLVPFFLWMFHLAVSEHAVGRRYFASWLMTGLAAGLLIVTKYTNGVFLAVAGVYCLIRFRREFLFGSFIAFIPFMLLLLPHLWFLIETDFSVFSYFAGRSVVSSTWHDHILLPVKFLSAQILSCWASLALFVSAAVMRRIDWRRADALVVMAAIGPLMIMTLVSGVFSVQMKSMWGSAMVVVAPALVVSAVRFDFARFTVRFGQAFVGLTVVLAVVMAIIQSVHTSFRVWVDFEELAAVAKTEWNAKYGSAPVPFVGGHVSVAAPVALALADGPRVFQSMDLVRNPWISEVDVRRRGVLIVEDNPALAEEYRERFPEIVGYREFPFSAKAPFGKTRTRRFFVGFLPPAGGGEK